MRNAIVAVTVVVFLFGGVASAGLVNYYSFNLQTLDDEASNYTQNSGLNETDLSMQLADGTDIRSPVHVLTFPTGIGTDYDGSGGDYAVHVKGNYHDYRGADQLDFPGSNADVNLGATGTIEMWIHSGETEANWGGHTSATFLKASNYNISLPSSKIPTVNVSGGTSTTGTVWPVGSWDHIAITYGGGTYQWYYNGVADGAAGTGDLSGTTTLQIGRYGAVRYTPGATDSWIDDLAMWDTTLSAATILAHADGTGLGLTVIPEPVTLSLVALAGVGLLRRRRKR